MSTQRILGLALVLLVALSACTNTGPNALDPHAPEELSVLTVANRYVIIANSTRLPANLDARVAAAGGVVVNRIPEIGVAIATSDSPSFLLTAARISGIQAVVPDLMVQWTDPPPARGDELAVEGPTPSSGALSAGFDPEDNPFYALQWAHQAVQTPEAWAAGYTGKGVRVAILDGAIYGNHVDLQENVDTAASRSFIPQDIPLWDWNQDLGTFWHGTHVAGIVAAAANNVGVIGIAPEATLIGVKVLHGGSGAFEWVMEGIVYAAKPLNAGGAGAHIINMSLGATINYRDEWQDKEFRDWFRALTMALDRATRYAYQQGVTVIASAGNGATNFDVAKELYKTPAQNQHVISVSATGPHGWALGATDFDRPTYYTDHGKSLVDLAAPGGTAGLWVVDGYDGVCTVQPLTNWCEAFDMYLSTSRGTSAAGGYSWAQGTSMASPVVAGIAALIIEENGGSMRPAQVRTRLQQSAADLGDPGKDVWYGHGWVNAWRAVQ